MKLLLAGFFFVSVYGESMYTEVYTFSTLQACNARRLTTEAYMSAVWTHSGVSLCAKEPGAE